MKYSTETYDLLLIDAADNTCKIVISPTNGLALKKERRKLYVIFHENQILYVGEANTSIKTRFQRGCTSFNYYIKNGNARGGYKEYKWLNNTNNNNRNLKVCVATFNEGYDFKRDYIEAIEGELVYLIRNEYGYWPKF